MGFNQFEKGCFQIKKRIFELCLFLLFFVGLLPSLIVDRFHILSNEGLIKYRLLCSAQVLSDSISILFRN